MALGTLRFATQLFDIFLLVTIASFLSLLAGFTEPNSQVEVLIFGALDSIIGSAGYPQVSLLLLAAVLFRLIASTLVLWASSRLTGEIESKFARKLIRMSMWDGTANQGASFSSQLQNSILLSTTAVAKGCGALVGLLSDVGFLLMLFLTAVFVDWRMAIGLASASALLGITIYFLITKRVKKASKAAIKASGGFLQEFKDMARLRLEIKLYGQSHYWLNRVSSRRRSSARNTHHGLFLNQLPRLILESSLFLGVVILSMLASTQVLGRSLVEASTLAVFLLLGLRFVSALSPILSLINQFAEVKGKGYEAMTALLYLRGRQSATSGASESLNRGLNGPVGVSIENLTFSYPGEAAILNGFTYNINPGEIVAIRGKSGKGKSTLLSLLIGLLNANSGQIRYFGENFQGISLADIRVGFVPQFPHVFRGSLGENIALSEYKESFEAEATLAASRAGLDMGTGRLSLGTQVDSEVEMMSGGQAQRLGLARALYISPNLLLLDEPTSALDQETKREVMNHVFSLRGQVTVIVVTHDESFLKEFDSQIYL